MSKQNGNPNPTIDETGKQPEPQPAPKGEPEMKQSFFARIRHGYDKFRASKWGRRVVRGAKIVGGGAAIFGAYEAGKHNAKPVTVYVEKMDEEKAEKPVETEPVEAPVEETNE